ncbi:MAG: hypothetical protein J0H09_29765 [Burkholderiales bacterium]|nr:hypothetical protein [Burkholderiales bacterium]
MKRVVIAVLFAASLSGCAAMFAEDIKLANAQCTKDLSVPELDPIRTKIVPLVESTTLQHLTDESTLDDGQRKALLLLDEKLAGCAKREKEMMLTKYNLAAYVSILDNGADRMRAARADLYTGKLTVGAFNKRAAELREQTRTELLAQDQRNAQIGAAQAASTAATIQAINALNPPRPVYAPPPMRTTNCRPIGNTVQCTTF